MLPSGLTTTTSGASRPMPAAQPGSGAPEMQPASGGGSWRSAPVFGLRTKARDRVAGPRGRVDVAAVGADRDRVRFVEADRRRASGGAFGGDAAIGLLRLGEDAGLAVAGEDRDRVAPRGGDVDVLAVGADRDRPRAHERARARRAPAPRRSRRPWPSGRPGSRACRRAGSASRAWASGASAPRRAPADERKSSQRLPPPAQTPVSPGSRRQPMRLGGRRQPAAQARAQRPPGIRSPTAADPDSQPG